MPITRSGYVGDRNRKERAELYNSLAWKQTRRAVKERAGGLCEWCGAPGVDAVHLAGRTLEILRAGRAFDLAELACGCRRCHSRFAAGQLGRPGGR